jgi:hypothetical protein
MPVGLGLAGLPIGILADDRDLLVAGREGAGDLTDGVNTAGRASYGTDRERRAPRALFQTMSLRSEFADRLTSLANDAPPCR